MSPVFPHTPAPGEGILTTPGVSWAPHGSMPLLLALYNKAFPAHFPPKSYSFNYSKAWLRVTSIMKTSRLPLSFSTHVERLPCWEQGWMRCSPSGDTFLCPQSGWMSWQHCMEGQLFIPESPHSPVSWGGWKWSGLKGHGSALNFILDFFESITRQ